MKRLLVLGAIGMLDDAMIRVLGEQEGLEDFGTVRSRDVERFFTAKKSVRLMSGIGVENQDALLNALRTSIVGHVLDSAIGLIDWFLGWQAQCRGFTRAKIFGLVGAVRA